MNFYSDEFLKSYGKLSKEERNEDQKQFRKEITEIIQKNYEQGTGMSIMFLDNGTIIVSRIPVKEIKITWNTETFEKWINETKGVQQ